MSEQQHKHQEGDTVLIDTDDSYNGLTGVIDHIEQPPSWRHWDPAGYRYYIRLKLKEAGHEATVQFYRHEIRSVQEVQS